MMSGAKPNTRKGWRVAVRNFVRLIGDVEMAAIDRPTVNRWADMLDSGDYAANTANAYMRQMRSVYNKAADAGLTSDDNPFRKAMIAPEPTVKRAVNALQFRRFLEADFSGLKPHQRKMREWARDVFLLTVMLRGIRPVDLWGIRRHDIADGYLTYRSSKTGKLMRFPLDDETERLIGSLGVTEWKMENHKGECAKVNYHLKRIWAQLGFRVSLTLYCARHTWASGAMASGASRSDISQMMGHSSEKTTEIYLDGLSTPLLDALHKETMRYLRGFG